MRTARSTKGFVIVRAEPAPSRGGLVTTWITLLAVTLLTAWAGVAGAQPAGEGEEPRTEALLGDGPWVVRVFVTERAKIDEIATWADVWTVEPEDGYLLALVDRSDYDRLAAEGLRITLDTRQTESLSRVGIPLKMQTGGIPGFPCYRTVEETYATADAIVAAHPDLASLIDVGDSWEKTQNALNGFDLRVLRLTQSAVPGPKPKLFANCAIHAREYTTAELCTRFAESLIAGYGSDPDVTWILDHHEVHLNLIANPDGRKQAETGLSWRKNTNNNYCSNTNDRGADLNRNFQFQWNCCGGSSTNQCSSTFNGAGPASEPEVAAIQSYLLSIFPDQRDPDLNAPAPDDSTGVMLDVHSSGGDVLWSWGFTTTDPPNDDQIWTLGRKYGFFTDYRPQSGSLSTVDGATKDFAYGELGVPGFTIELGTQFFEACSVFEGVIVPDNLPALLYTAKVVRTPYLTPAGPEALSPSVLPVPYVAGDQAVLTATLDDTRYTANNGTEPTQTIASADFFVDDPPWSAGAVAQAMTATDGAFDQQIEPVDGTVDTSSLAPGRHTLFVRGTDADLNDGAVSAVFLHVIDPGVAPVVQGLVRDAVTLAPLAATVTLGEFVTATDPGTGLYSLQVPSGTYDITADVTGYQSQTAPGVVANDFATVQQDFDLLVETVCGDGICQADEDCNGCPADCPSFPLGASCGNGICEAGDGEDCVTCAQDCNGLQGGKPANRFCCGFGGDGPVGCGDTACTTGGFSCTETPVGGSGSTCCGDLTCESPEDGFNCSLDCGQPPVCGDGSCDPGEDECSCAADCGAPPATEAGLCTDGTDNDCDLAVDCADPDCDGIDPACQAPDCSSFGDKSSCNAQASCRWDNKNKVCVPN